MTLIGILSRSSTVDGPREPAAPYDRLIQSERVHGSPYTSPEIFADELEQIWYRTWVGTT